MKENVDVDLLSRVVKSLKQGDKVARGQFYDLTHKAIYRFSYFLSKDEHSAHDLCHDTFVKALVNINTLKNDQGALSWLFQITRNTFLDQKKKKKEELVMDYNSIEPSHGGGFEEWLSVKKALQTFDINDQMILIMVDLEGLSYKEAAEASGLSEDAIRMKLHRIRQDFIKNYNTPETN